VRAFVREGWVNRDTGKQGDPRIQFNNFQLLHDVMDAYAKKLSIQLNIHDLEQQQVHRLNDVLSLHKGKHNLNFIIYDDADQIKLQMPSRKKKVKISQELLSELEEIDIRYHLN
jgi:DNA polymerase-3 subunit alpha